MDFDQSILNLLEFSTYTYCRNKNTCYLYDLSELFLLKMKCQETHFYMKTECLQTK